MHALEAADDRDLLARLEALDQLLTIDVEDAGGRMRVRCGDRQLPALPRTRVHADRLQRDRQQPRRDLLAGRHHGGVFARVVQDRGLAAPFDQLIGRPRHRGHDHRDIVAGIDLTLDVARHVADALDVGDGRSAEFHHQPAHTGLGAPMHQPGGWRDGNGRAQAQKGAYT